MIHDETTRSQAPTLLAVLAHPDDESFGMGGTLAHYADRGVQVHYLCMTGGESGTVEPEFLRNFGSISELRAHELACAARELGLTSHFFSGYRDSGMRGTPDNDHPKALVNQPVEEVAALVAHHIRRLRPQVIVTHDPIGGYLHPDHIAAHKATVRAFQSAGDPQAYPTDELPAYQPQKLYYNAFSKRFLKIMTAVLRLLGRNPAQFGRNQDVNLFELAEAGDFPIHARINVRASLPKRDRASACHASQLGSGPPNRGVLAFLLRYLRAHETYMRAYPQAPDGLRESDLFSGVEIG